MEKISKYLKIVPVIGIVFGLFLMIYSGRDYYQQFFYGPQTPVVGVYLILVCVMLLIHFSDKNKTNEALRLARDSNDLTNQTLINQRQQLIHSMLINRLEKCTEKNLNEWRVFIDETTTFYRWFNKGNPEDTFKVDEYIKAFNEKNVEVTRMAMTLADGSRAISKLPENDEKNEIRESYRYTALGLDLIPYETTQIVDMLEKLVDGIEDLKNYIKTPLIDDLKIIQNEYANIDPRIK